MRASAAPISPLSADASGRFFRTPTGTPVLLNCDTAWSIGRYVADADLAAYFADRQSRGFNSFIFSMIERYDANNTTGVNFNGDTPFTGTTAGQPDLSTPRTAFWNRVDLILNTAKVYGQTGIAFPMYLGSNGGAEGWYAALGANSSAKAQAYGTFLGQRYASQSNLIWCMGGDLSQTSTPTAMSSAVYSQLDDLCDALRVADTNHIVTGHFERGLYTAQEPTPGGQDKGSWNDLNGVYARYWSNASLSLDAYAATPTAPAFLIEGDYAPGDTDQHIRAQPYQSVLSGNGGINYGNTYIWNYQGAVGFSPDGNATTWQSHLNDVSCLDHARAYAALNALPWYRFVPGSCVTSGQGSFGTSAGGGTMGDYISAAATAAGDCMAAYLPHPHAGTFSLDMTKMAGTTRARWWDPRAGTWTTDAASPLANTGTHSFTRPAGNNAAGDHDWMLLLESP